MFGALDRVEERLCQSTVLRWTPDYRVGEISVQPYLWAVYYIRCSLYFPELRFGESCDGKGVPYLFLEEAMIGYVCFFSVEIALIIDVAQSCACPNRTVYSVGTFGSSCVILPARFSQQHSVRWVIPHYSRCIVAFLRSLYPCVIFISASDWYFLTIVAVAADYHLQEIRYQNHFFRLRMPPVLKIFLSKFCEISSISLVSCKAEALLLNSSSVTVFMREVA